MTVPVGIAAFLLHPDTPHNTSVWYLSEDEKRLALNRVAKAGKAPPAKLSKTTIGRMAKGWSKGNRRLGHFGLKLIMRRVVRLYTRLCAIRIELSSFELLCHLAKGRKVLRYRPQSHSDRFQSDLGFLCRPGEFT